MPSPVHFEKCEKFHQPTWLRILPIDANDLWREEQCARDRKEAREMRRVETRISL